MPRAVDPKLFAQWLGECRERLDLALPHVRQRQLVVQAGGNLGYWARLLVDEYDFAQVVSFEPDARNFYCLLHNVGRRPVVCHLAALGRRHDLLPFWRDPRPDRPGWHRIAGGGFQGGQSPAVDVVALDQLELPACNLLALDVEGYELEALKGATVTVEKYRPVVIIEDLGRSRFAAFRRRSTVAFGHPPGAVQRWLKKRGYRKVAEVRNDEVHAYKAV